MKKAINRNNWKKENYHTKTNTSDLTQHQKKLENKNYKKNE